MSLYTFETLTPSPKPQATLAVLTTAIGDRVVPARNRVVVSEESRSPDEGLALLSAYLSIEDRAVRQAVLDAVLAIAGTDPYR